MPPPPVSPVQWKAQWQHLHLRDDFVMKEGLMSPSILQKYLKHWDIVHNVTRYSLENKFDGNNYKASINKKKRQIISCIPV